MLYVDASSFSKKEIIQGELFYDFENPADIYSFNRRKPLGALIERVNASGFFKKGFERKFACYLRDRNRLVHHVFLERRFEGMNNLRALSALNRFVAKLIRRAAFFRDIFQGFFLLHIQVGIETGHITSSTHSQQELVESFDLFLSRPEEVKNRVLLRQHALRRR